MVEVNEARRGDSARAAVELISKAMEGVTPGPWTVDDERGDYEIAIVGRPTWKCTRFGVEGEWDVAQIEIIDDRDAETQANAAYIAACSPDRMGVVLLAYRTLEDEVEGLKLTRQHSRIAAAGLYDAFEGEKKRAQAAEAKLEALKREIAELREALLPFADEAGCYDPDSGDGDDSLWATPSYFKIRDLRLARALLSKESADADRAEQDGSASSSSGTDEACPGEHQEVLDAIQSHNSGEDE